MGRWTAESTGISVLRPIAEQRLKRVETRRRIWSDELSAWGFYSSNPNESDVFLLLCCSQPGDMLYVNEHDRCLFSVPDCKPVIVSATKKPYVVLQLKEFDFQGTRLYGLELLGQNPPIICQLLSQKQTLFKIAWEFLP